MKLITIAFALALPMAAVYATPPEVDPGKDLPRVPPTAPADALKTFHVKKGYHLELAASEPLVQSPVAIAFDENGRMFVAEMIDYSERYDERPHAGRVVMLESTKGDGHYDKSTVYADDLPWPTGIFCYGGGVFVAATPNIVYLKDTKHDGKADLRKVIYSGFGNTRDRLNVQGLVNGFNWGLDNRIHGLTAPNGGIVTNMTLPSRPTLNLDRRNFEFDPRTDIMHPEQGGGQYGMSFDSQGNKFTCNNSDHIQYFMYDARYADRNPLYAMPPALASIAVEGPAAEVFRISPEERWRVLRTQWRVAGLATGPVEGGGRSSGYFTGATGITIYRGNAMPDLTGDAFVAEVAFNLIHHKKVFADDVGFKAQRLPDEQNVEFLASTDNWFRPVLFANAPDGTLYMIDMCREVIEHPWSLPEQLKKHLDLNSGNDRGRIYHIVPDGFQDPPPPHLGKAKTKELVAALDNPNGWTRDTASRLLYERQPKAAVPLLLKLLQNGSALGRLHALHALDGLGALHEDNILTTLNDSDFTVREHAVKLSEKFLQNPSAELWSKLQELAADPSVRVRYQLAFTLGEIKNPDRIKTLAAIVKSDTGSAFMQAAVFSSLAEGAGEMFTLAAADADFRAKSSGEDFLKQLVELIGAKNNPAEVTSVLAYLATVNDPGLSFSMLGALGDGLKRANSSLEAVDQDGKMKIIFAKASQMAADTKADPKPRLEAIQLLGVTSFDDSSATLLGVLDSIEPQDIQLAALSTLARFNDPRVAAELIRRWSSFTPRMRSEAMNVLVARTERASALLKAIAKKTIPANELTTAQIKFLRTHRDQTIRDEAATVLGPVTASKRQDVINNYMSALSLKGDAALGQKVYESRCISCHRLAGEGHAVGPDLVTVKTQGKQKIMVNIIDPNLEVAPGFQAFEVELKDGDSLIGIISSETANSVTVRQPFGKEDVVMRSNIARIKNQNQSLMPEGLEAGLKPQDFANLLEFITTAQADK